MRIASTPTPPRAAGRSGGARLQGRSRSQRTRPGRSSSSPFSRPAGLPIVLATATGPRATPREVMAFDPATLGLAATLRVAPGQALVFSSASGHVLAIQDPNVGPLEVAPVPPPVPAGTLTLSSTAGLTGSGDGTGSLASIPAARLSAVNAALAGAYLASGLGHLTLSVNAQSGGPGRSRGPASFLVTTGQFAVVHRSNGAGSLRRLILGPTPTRWEPTRSTSTSPVPVLHRRSR